MLYYCMKPDTKTKTERRFGRMFKSAQAAKRLAIKAGLILYQYPDQTRRPIWWPGQSPDYDSRKFSIR